MTSTSKEPITNTEYAQPLTDRAPKQYTGLGEAPGDVHYLIASELIKTSPSTVLALGQSSAGLREATLPFIYRNVVLKKDPENSHTERAYEALIANFRNDASCNVAQYVRCITIKDDLPEEDLLLILNKISECGILHSLRWETAAHMPASVLDKIQTAWPELELSVYVLNRHQSKVAEYRQMDTRLLSSPLLKSLTYNVYRQGYQTRQLARSEWPRLTQALVTGGHVRALRLQSQADGRYYREPKVLDATEPEKLMRLDITPDMRLPALEELSISDLRDYGDSTYLWDEDHCRMLRDTMDLSRLRKLDFDTERPDAFFTVFAGIMPGLTHLRCGTDNGSIGALRFFMESATALESLDIDGTAAAMENLWPTIMGHKDSLRELILRPTRGQYRDAYYMDFNRLEIVREQFPGLERLGWRVPCHESADPKYIAMFATMGLKKLDLFLYIPGKASDYSAELRQNAMGTIEPPPLDKVKSKATAIAIMDTVSQAQKQPLEWLTLHITRTGYSDRAQSYLMHAKMQVRRTNKGDVQGDGNYEVRGNQTWEGAADLNEQLMLNEE